MPAMWRQPLRRQPSPLRDTNARKIVLSPFDDGGVLFRALVPRRGLG